MAGPSAADWSGAGHRRRRRRWIGRSGTGRQCRAADHGAIRDTDHRSPTLSAVHAGRRRCGRSVAALHPLPWPPDREVAAARRPCAGASGLRACMSPMDVAGRPGDAGPRRCAAPPSGAVTVDHAAPPPRPDMLLTPRAEADRLVARLADPAASHSPRMPRSWRRAAMAGRWRVPPRHVSRPVRGGGGIGGRAARRVAQPADPAGAGWPGHGWRSRLFAG